MSEYQNIWNINTDVGSYNTKSNYQNDKGDVMTYIKFSDVKRYISSMTDNGKKCELLDQVGEDFIQTYLREKKIKKILKK